jgi:hypothetical protein
VTGASASESSDDDVNLYGINTNYSLGDERNSEVEAYFWMLEDNGTQSVSTAFGSGSGAVGNGTKDDTILTPGLRVSSNPIDGLYTSAEVAWQFGNKAVVSTANGVVDNLKRNAMGAQVISSFAIPGDAIEEYKPVVGGSYTFVSGDSNPTNGRDTWMPASQEKYTAWDPMFEDQGGGTIYNTLFSLTNAHIYNTNVSVTPLEDVTVRGNWWSIWLDKEFDQAAGTSTFTLLQPDGTTATAGVIDDETSVGNELDIDVIWDYTEDVQFGFSAGWFFPGDIFTERNDAIAKQFLTTANVNF